MPKIFRHTETKEINSFLSKSTKISPSLKKTLQDELKSVEAKHKSDIIFLTETKEHISIDVFDIKGDAIENHKFFY